MHDNFYNFYTFAQMYQSDSGTIMYSVTRSHIFLRETHIIQRRVLSSQRKDVL